MSIPGAKKSGARPAKEQYQGRQLAFRRSIAARVSVPCPFGPS